MRKAMLAQCLLWAAASPALAQYASPQVAAPSGHYIRVPRAAPQAVAPRDIGPPLTYEAVAPRQRIEVREVPAPRAPAAWRITGYRTPLCGHHKVKLGRWLIRKGSPRPVFELVEAPLDTATIQVVQEQPQAVAVAPAEDLVYVPDEEPVFAQRAVPPPKAPPIPTPKLAPRAIAPPKLAPRAVPSPQQEPGARSPEPGTGEKEGDEAPPPPMEEAPGDSGA